jgi:hypothetical protein
LASGGRRRRSGGDGEEQPGRGALVLVLGGGGGAKSGNVWVEDGGPRRARARRQQWWRRRAVRAQGAWLPFIGKGGGGEWSGKRSAPPGGGRFGLGRADGEATAGGSAGGRRGGVAAFRAGKGMWHRRSSQRGAESLETGGARPNLEGFAVSPAPAYGRRAVRERGERELMAFS